ncbi:MAG: YihY/virulence factor BrkB family protein [Clostridia bacterium]|nr:YihY/virulence factor BrkB family protein [Clostridia bacterium]
MTNFINRFKRMFIVCFRQIQDPYYHGFAAQISFYLMLSVVPIFLLIVQVLGLFDISTETALDIIEQYTGRHMSGLISSLFEFNYLGFGNIVFLIIAFWAGSRASFAISRITNYTLTEGENTGKNYFIERARAIITMLLTMVTLVLALIILCYGKVILLGILNLLHVKDLSFVDSFWMWLRWPLGFVLYFFIIGYNYYILPTVRRPFRTVIPGAMFAAIGMLIVSWAYSFYTGTLVNYDIMYGALSSVVAIMIWFLLLSWVIILGVMCNKVFENTSKPFSKKDPPEHLKMSEEERARHEELIKHQSKFDMDPEDVNIHTIKNILAGGGKAEKPDGDQQRKPINKQ